jgi:hypothetical protein
MPFVKNINIGTIYSVYDTLCDDIADEEKVQGCYRSLEELLITLAEFYLSNPIDLVWFDDVNKFYVSLGWRWSTICQVRFSLCLVGELAESRERYFK